MNKFAIVDIETAGDMPGVDDRIIEIGIAIYLDGNIIDTFETLINPCREISYQARRIHNIDDSMVEDAPYAKEALGYAFEFVGDLPLVAHNKSFESRLINSEIKRINPNNEVDFLCTLLLSRRVFLGLESHSLTNLVNHFRLPKETSHRALGDAIMTSHLLKKIQDEIESVSDYGTSFTADDYLKVMDEPLKTFKNYGLLNVINKVVNKRSKSTYQKTIFVLEKKESLVQFHCGFKLNKLFACFIASKLSQMTTLTKSNQSS